MRSTAAAMASSSDPTADATPASSVFITSTIWRDDSRSRSALFGLRPSETRARRSSVLLGMEWSFASADQGVPFARRESHALGIEEMQRLGRKGQAHGVAALVGGAAIRLDHEVPLVTQIEMQERLAAQALGHKDTG